MYSLVFVHASVNETDLVLRSNVLLCVLFLNKNKNKDTSDVQSSHTSLFIVLELRDPLTKRVLAHCYRTPLRLRTVELVQPLMAYQMLAASEAVSFVDKQLVGARWAIGQQSFCAAALD